MTATAQPIDQGARDEATAETITGPATARHRSRSGHHGIPLVLLGAAVIALLVVSWATSGGGAGKIGHLFDRVIDAIGDKI